MLAQFHAPCAGKSHAPAPLPSLCPGLRRLTNISSACNTRKTEWRINKVWQYALSHRFSHLEQDMWLTPHAQWHMYRPAALLQHQQLSIHSLWQAPAVAVQSSGMTRRTTM